MADDRKKQNLEVLRNAVDRGRTGGNGAPGSGGGGAGGQIMYRGKPVGRAGGGGGGAPGAPGSSRGRPPANQGQANDGGDVKDALRKLTQLFNDGLITTAEYDAKRAEILNRL